MCGLAGFIPSSVVSATDKVNVQKMMDAGSHRGPDSNDLFANECLVLAHARLAIIDVGPSANQPMTISGYTLVFNGEIYNYKEIRSELISLDIKFDTQGDTEVVLRAFIKWGNEAVKKFNGMWALAIYDVKKRELFFSRDRFGEKPLYFYNTHEGLYFASEVKQILEVVASPKFNRDIAISYLLGGMENHTEQTFIQGVYSLSAGTNVIYDFNTGMGIPETYYNLDAAIRSDNGVHDYNKSEFSELFEDSVRLRLRSDVQVGLCVSGGIDSTAIAVAASKVLGDDRSKLLSGLHMSSFEPQYDESEFAKALAKKSGLQLDIVMPDADTLQSQIDEVARCQDEPFGGPSMLMGMNLYSHASHKGLKVMLSGQGADEVFLGYDRYVSAAASFGELKTFKGIIANLDRTGLSLKQFIQYIIYFRSSNIRSLITRRRSFVRPEVLAQYADKDIEELCASFGNIKNMQLSEIKKFQLPHLLRYEDRNSMHSGVEVRVPFLDHRLVEYGLKLKLDDKISDGWMKYPIRDYLSNNGLDEIAWRKKKFGFEAPKDHWLSKHKQIIVSEIKSSFALSQIVDTTALIDNITSMPINVWWRYYSFAVWARNFSVS